MKVTIEDIKAKIQQIKNLDLEKVLFDDVFYLVRDLMLGYKSVAFPARNFKVYRARINKEVENFQKVSDLWYPPKDAVKEFNRANNLRESIFYCSNNIGTSVLELRPSKGDIVSIIECQINTDKLAIIGLGFPDKSIFKGSGKIINWAERRRSSIEKHLKNLQLEQPIIEEQIKKNELIDVFLNEEFRKIVINRDFEYKISAAIATMFLNNPKGSPVQGICYPSISTRYEGYNWAFVPKAVDAFFIPTRFLRIKILDKKENGVYETSILSRANQTDCGTIIWGKKEKH